MVIRAARSLLLLFPLLLTSAVAATAAPQPTPSEGAAASGDQAIIVTGEKDVRKTIDQFVRALTPVPSGGQLARFEHSVCPAVFGLAKPQADAVIGRMRLVAKTVGIAVDGSGCAPNVFVLATSDKKRLVRELWRQASQYFDSESQERDVEREAGPAAAWQIGGPPVSARGQELYVDPSIGEYVNRTTEAMSRLTESARPQFEAAVVVVEKKALIGLTTTQLADYAAIRAFTGANPAKLKNSSAPTILHVLDIPMGGEAPITMTKWDLAFVRGYYDVDRNHLTGAQRSAIGRKMDKDVREPSGR